MSRHEPDLTQELLKDLRKRHPNWTILKHSDRFTIGIPDISVSKIPWRTVWLEVKRLKGQAIRQVGWCDNQVQLETTCGLGGFYLVMDPHGEDLLVEAAWVREAVRGNRWIRPEAGVTGSGLDLLEKLLTHILDQGAEDVNLRLL